MSRRPANPNADRAAANQQALKALVKLESNKSCADCKKNKHPRWASWNLGIFVCIRCSGIHRGMGTHISRVKSVDLDAWTDEQLASMLKWGNARANRYWEAKLAPGHVPSDAKIENFIRTKYDSKRWAMDGPMPDPATLDGAEEEGMPVPPAQEQSPPQQRTAASRSRLGPAPQAAATSASKQNQVVDLFGDVPSEAPVSTTQRQSNVPAAPPKPQAAPRAPQKAGESLLGFDFFNAHSQASAPARPSSATAALSSATGPSRPDLKQSILSLYATTPRSATSTPTPSAPSAPSAQTVRPSSNGLNDFASDFGSLNFGAPPVAKASLASPVTSPSLPSVPISSPLASTTKPLSGGSFFDSKPSAVTSSTSASRPSQSRVVSSSSAFGDFESAADAGWGSPSPPPLSTTTAPSSGFGDMLDFSAPSTTTKPAPTSNLMDSSAFNLSAPKPSAPKSSQPGQAASAVPTMMDDPWGSNDAWSTPVSAPAPTSTAPTSSAKAPVSISSGADDWGWGNPVSNTPAAPAAPAKSNEVTADEDFGGWESYASAPAPPPMTKPTASSTSKPSAGFASNDNDLFSNVWG